MGSAGGVSPWASQGVKIGRLAAIVVGRAMFQAERWLSALYLFVSLCVASLTAGFVYASGSAISSIPAAVAGGRGSPALDHVMAIVMVMGGLFFLQQLCVTLQGMLAATIGRRVEGNLRTRLFRALARPRRIDHLNDPEVATKVAAASTVGTARYGVADALFFGTPALNAFLFGLWMAALIAAFNWWLALLLLGLSLAVRLLVHREALHYWAALGFQTTGSQRAVYFRDLGLTAAAAKEVRIFGLSDWIVGRFRDHWSTADETDALKRASVHASLWLALPILALNGLGFFMIVAALQTGAIDLHQFAVTAQALVGVSILGVSWRDEVVVTWGAATVPAPDSWRRNIAVLFQDFVHYPFSAADNVLFGAFEHRPQPGDLDRIARQTGLAELVGSLPGGWDTLLSRQYRGGRDLSGGQWQRVALARALWAVEAGAKILILDEPTANLDVRAEARFYEQFLDLSRGLTTILISHRFASVRRADHIVVIGDGHVVERGNHEALMRGETRYARMFAAQTEDYASEVSDA